MMERRIIVDGYDMRVSVVLVDDRYHMTAEYWKGALGPEHCLILEQDFSADQYEDIESAELWQDIDETLRIEIYFNRGAPCENCGNKKHECSCQYPVYPQKLPIWATL